MAKVTYSSLKLKTNTDIKIIEFNGIKIDVLQYLPIEDKYSLVNISLQKSQEKSIYNPMKKDVFFHLNLVYMYTNITFTDKQREDESKLYDTLCSSGLMTEILKAIPETEYEALYSYIEELEDDILNYQNTFAGVAKEIIDTLPIKAEEMQKIVDNFDQTKFQNVMEFAKYANGGREIK